MFKADEIDYLHNGLGRLNNLTKNEVTEVLNGEFELELEYPVIEDKYPLIRDSMLVLAKPNKKDEPHLFRIYEHEVSSDNDSLNIKARSINYDLFNNLLVYLEVSDQTPEEAMTSMKAVAIDQCDFTFTSDITTKSSTLWTKRNLLNCITGQEGSLIQIWGGEIKHLNKHLILYKNRGKKNVTTIRHARNLRGLRVVYSIQGLVTTIVPYFKIRDEETDSEDLVVGDIVRSQYVNNYPHPHSLFVEFTAEEHGIDIEVENEDGTTTTEKYIDIDILNDVAAHWFEENSGVDLPVINVTADLEDLSQMEDYEKFKALEEVNLGDTVTVYSEKYKVDITSKVIKLVYDGLSDKVVSVELGQKASTGYQVYKELVDRSVEPLKTEVNNVMIAANKKNKIFRGEQEPSHSMIKNDIWYKPVGQGEVEMYRYDGLIWRIEKVSGGLIQGVLDAESGDLDIINLNASNITTGFLEGERILLRGVGTAGEDLDLVSLLAARDETYSSQIESILEDDSISPAERLELQGTFLRIQRESREFYDQLIATENPDLIQIAEDMMVATDVLLEALEHVIGAEGYEDIDFEEMTILFNNYDELIVPVRDAVTALVDNRIKVYENQLKIEDDMITMMVHTDAGLNPVMSLGQEELAFYSEGEKVSWFAQRQMMIENAVVIQQLEIGNHIMKKYAGNKFTVFQWVGA